MTRNYWEEGMEQSVAQVLRGATVDDLGWLEGGWIGRHDAGSVEMHWSTPAAQTIVGMFRWIALNRLYFCELLLIEKELDKIVLRLKNFDSGFLEWETPNEPMTFDLMTLGKNRCVFDLRTLQRSASLLYELEDPNTMHVHFEVVGGPPESRYEFGLQRKK